MDILFPKHICINFFLHVPFELCNFIESDIHITPEISNSKTLLSQKQTSLFTIDFITLFDNFSALCPYHLHDTKKQFFDITIIATTNRSYTE